MTTELDTASFDSRADVRTLLRQVTAELRRLERVNDRLTRTRVRHRLRSGLVEATLEVRARSEAEAAEFSIAVLRTSVHAAGGSTAGWNHLGSGAGRRPLVAN